MADTTNFAWSKPTVGGSAGTWGDELNAVIDDVDADLYAAKTEVDPANYTDSHTLIAFDAGKFLTITKASAVTLTVPTNASVAFPIGTRIELCQMGAGQITVAAAGGVTIRSAGSRLKLRAQYSAAALQKYNTDEWVLMGDLTS